MNICIDIDIDICIDRYGSAKNICYEGKLIRVAK